MELGSKARRYLQTEGYDFLIDDEKMGCSSNKKKINKNKYIL